MLSAVGGRIREGKMRLVYRSAIRQALTLTSLCVCLNGINSVLEAKVTLPAMLSSHMVLQRSQPIHLWGWATPDEKVAVDFNQIHQSGVADRLGKWDIFLPPQPAGGPYTLAIKAENTIQLDDVMLGDVWFASGQSNMEMPLAGFPGSAVVTNAAEEIRNANQLALRLLLIPHKTSDFPMRDFEPTAWTKCTPETAAQFSAVAYFFGRQLAEHEHVTIGLIDSTWGGTPAEAWISMHGLSSEPSLMPVFAEWASFADEQTEIKAIIEAEKREDEAARKAGQPAPQHSWHPHPGSWQPAALYNGMVAPAINFGIKGVVWYQGESNSVNSRANLYEKVLPALITDWRSNWHQGNFPFLFVQIANFKSGPHETWAIVREAQRRTLALAQTGMAVTIDIGDPDNVHPSNKQDVGLRLSLAARKIAYGEDVEDAGPMLRKTTTEGQTMRVWFDHLSKGLAIRGNGPLSGFAIAGEDRHFVSANAQIDVDNVVVSAEGVAQPKYVRYGWENSPALNLVNGSGLPASPFTTEDQIPRP
jgi:sialate O-acetylesterase